MSDTNGSGVGAGGNNGDFGTDPGGNVDLAASGGITDISMAFSSAGQTAYDQASTTNETFDQAMAQASAAPAGSIGSTSVGGTSYLLETFGAGKVALVAEAAPQPWVGNSGDQYGSQAGG